MQLVQIFDVLCGETVRLSVLFLERSFRFWRDLVTLVDSHATVFSEAGFLHVVCEDSFDVHVETEEPCQALLAQHSLALKIALCDILCRQKLRLEKRRPSAETIFHDAQLQELHLQS